MVAPNRVPAWNPALLVAAQWVRDLETYSSGGWSQGRWKGLAAGEPAKVKSAGAISNKKWSIQKENAMGI